MKLLVLGGTRFVGRHVVGAALADGHDVTLFNRGVSAPGLFDGDVRFLRGNRQGGGVSALRAASFEGVIDVTAYRPSDVETVLGALADPAVPYALVSTVSVYAEPIAPNSDEDAAVIALTTGGRRPEDSADAYGGLKARCERVAPPHALIVRPGVVAGPYDWTERVTRWARRAAEGDPVIAGDPRQPIQFIDARDLAKFLLHGITAGVAGTYNAVTEPVPFHAFLDAAGAEDRVVWAGRERLRRAGVEFWSELPMTLPPEEESFLTFSSARARRAGLLTRPLAETLADIRAWDADRPAIERRDPLSRDRERALLETSTDPA